MSGKSINYDVEVLRVTAIGLVLLEHTSILHDILDMGKLASQRYFGVGVDLFFAISGFVVTRSALRMSAKPGVGAVAGLISFVGRRLARLLPASVAWIVITLATVVAINDPSRFSVIGENLSGALPALFGYANYHAWRIDVLDTTIYHLLAPWWSLSLELQFYLAFGLLFFLGGRAVTGIVLAAGAVVFLMLPKASGDHLWFFRMDGFAIGGLLALTIDRLSPEPFRMAWFRWAG